MNVYVHRLKEVSVFLKSASRVYELIWKELSL